MDGDLIEYLILIGIPVKESIEARRRGGVTARYVGDDLHVNVYHGFDRAPDSWDVNIIEYTTQLATTLRSLGQHVAMTKMDEHHGAMYTFTPSPDPWRPR
jgi:hypothetical protein